MSPSRTRGLSPSCRARLFFATDIHGSEVCFRKFVNAGRFYDVQYLLLGGDITGKALVPIRKTPTGWSLQYLEERYDGLTDREKTEVERRIRDSGYYTIAGSRDELDWLLDDDRREESFSRIVCESVSRWVEFAETRLHGSGIRCFVTPGNDDFLAVDDSLQGSDVVEFVDGQCVQLDDRHEMITTGYSNPTPWNSPRELAEPDLGGLLERVAGYVTDFDNLLAVLHVPPCDTTLDRAPKLSDDLELVREAGTLQLTSVGSSAVREFISVHQPLCGLHGHVHESKGAELIGRTLCINPGSEYSDGTLCGAILTLGDGCVDSYQLVNG